MAPNRSVRQRLEAASSLLNSGDWFAAYEELESLPPEISSSADVLVLRCGIYAMAGQWTDVERIAKDAAIEHPDNFRFFTHWAWALHRQGRTGEGLDVVAGVAERFPNSGATAYAIACLNGALGRTDEAQHWLVEAFQRHDTGALRAKAYKQPELAGLWRLLKKEQA